MMNKTITLNEDVWNNIIEAVSYAAEQAEEVAKLDPDVQDVCDKWNSLADILIEKLDS